MYTTPDEVMASTPYENVSVAEILQAQFIVEIYTGRLEGEVDGARDKGLLARATIAQTVYMRDNPDIAFQQIAAGTIQTGGEMTVFRNGDNASPFVAPLAILACQHLSWKTSRSVRVGRIFQNRFRADWSRD